MQSTYKIEFNVPKSLLLKKKYLFTMNNEKIKHYKKYFEIFNFQTKLANKCDLIHIYDYRV